MSIGENKKVFTYPAVQHSTQSSTNKTKERHLRFICLMALLFKKSYFFQFHGKVLFLQQKKN